MKPCTSRPIKPNYKAQWLKSRTTHCFLFCVVRSTIMNDVEKRKVIDSFKNDLKELMAKYNFGKKEHDNYNGSEVYCGTDIYLTIEGSEYYGETLSEILDECI